MKRILLLLLFNFSIVVAFAQSNTYHKSIHIINSDSTHGELDGTEYINSAGKWRYKEAGTWKYRLSTAGANALFVKLTGNETISGVKTFSTPIASGSGGTGLSTYTTGDLIHAISTNTLGKLSAVATGNVLLSGGVGAISSWGKVALSTHVSGTLPVANGGTGLSSLGSALQVLRVNAGGTALEFAAASSASPAGSTNAIQINSSGSFGAGNMAVLTNSVYNLSAGTNWYLGWNASGTSGSVDARRMTVGALGISIGPFVTDPLTSLHVEKSVSGVGGGDDIGEAIRMRSTYNAITPLVGSGVRLSFESETSDGNYEIGGAIEAMTTDVTSASEDFDLVFYNMAGGATAAETFRVTSAGNATLVGTGTGVDWVATSDRRLKYNFKPVYNQLDKIGTIADLVTNYDRKDNGKNETGFIAQELLKVAPEYVNVPQDTASGYYSVNYSKMVVPLYTGVNELQEEVVALRQEVAELKAIVKEFRRITLEASVK